MTRTVTSTTDILSANWTITGAATIHEAISDSAVSTFVQANIDGVSFEVGFPAIAPPTVLTATHKIQFYGRSAFIGIQDNQVVVRLLANSVIIFTSAPIILVGQTVQFYEVDFTSITPIADYSLLSVRFTDIMPPVDRRTRINDMNLLLPDLVQPKNTDARTTRSGQLQLGRAQAGGVAAATARSSFTSLRAQAGGLSAGKSKVG